MNQTFTIQGCLPTMNDIIRVRGHNRYGYGAFKKETDTLVWYAIKEYHIQPIAKQIDVCITWVCKDKRKDKDNVCAGIKFILDALQLANIFKNDGWTEIRYIKHDFAIDKNNPRVEVTLKEVEQDLT